MSTLHNAVIVACSFGKDSLITLDLCCKHFKRVECLHMVYVDGLEITRKRCEYVKQRWKVDVTIVEHWGANEHCRLGYRCFPDASRRKRTIRNVYEDAKQQLNCKIVATGTRASEDIGRRAGIIRNQRGQQAGAWPGEWHPLAWWRHNKQHSDIVTYLRHNNIEPFESIEGCKHGMSNDAATILMLHDRYPEDYAKWVEKFPLASCVVKRRELYGIA